MNCDRERLARVRMIADYQFGKGIGKELFPEGATFQLSRTKRVRQVFHSGKRIATARAKDGFFTLSIEGASIVHRLLPGRKLRVVISEEAVPSSVGLCSLCRCRNRRDVAAIANGYS